MNMTFKKQSVVAFIGFLMLNSSVFAQTIDAWVTKSDRSALLEKQTEEISFSYKKGRPNPIVIDDRQFYQEMDGFGYSLTGGSAELLMQMSAAKRSEILKELFTSGADGGAGISYIRLTIGASDLNSFVFSYDDLKDGDTDLKLKKFNLAQDMNDVVPVMKEILAINPEIPIMASPWSAPAWMKTNNNVRGGSLKEEYHSVYGQYFVKYIQKMAKQGINIGAITVQNEPLNERNTPSMQWQRSQMADFIKNHLGPAFTSSGITTKIMLFDHNTDRIDYPLALMSDPEVDQYVDGSAFHNYRGDMSSMSDLHRARPDKNLYFTEQMVVERWDDGILNITAPVTRLLIGATRNWSRSVILWNLAADPNDDPHTDNGGCPFCQGALTIDGDQVSKNLAYYAIAHASKFVPAGSKRIMSTGVGESVVSLTQDEENGSIHRATVIADAHVMPNVAFFTPQEEIVLIVANDTFSSKSFQVQYNGQYAEIKLEPGAVGTYRWKASKK